MCLTIPGKIKSINNGIAVVENGARSDQIDLGVVLDAKVGDWVLYATNRAVRLIDDQEAREIIELLEDNYQPVDISALPLEYKKIINKVRHPKQNQKSKVIGQNSNSKFVNNNSTIQQLNNLSKEDIKYILKLRGGNNLEALYSEANVLRKERLEDFVCIHGIVEFSNFCRNSCLYCGIGAGAKIRRYRMSEAEIFMAVKFAVEKEGYKLVVLQSGEDESFSNDDLVALIDRIKKNLRVFVFISVGERSREFYQKAFEAGASGSLFRFETSNKELYKRLHPGHNLRERLRCLKDQIEIGYYVASGGLIGVPGQTVSDLADDLLLVKKLGIPMLSSGPWIPSGNSPLGISNSKFPSSTGSDCPERASNGQMSNEIINQRVIPVKTGIQDHDSGFDTMSGMTEEDKLRLTLNYIAAARLLIPEIKIPVTTALETLDPERGRHRGLLAGANALMFNITPDKYRDDYNLYDHKYIERERVWQKYGLFKGEESYEMLEERLQI